MKCLLLTFALGCSKVTDLMVLEGNHFDLSDRGWLVLGVGMVG